MKKYTTLTKIVLYISFISAVIWTGSYLLRMFLFYQLFTIRDFQLKGFLQEADLYAIFMVLLPAVTTTFFTYLLFLISFILFFWLSKIKLRENGWFFIITVIIIITAPFELFLMNIDLSIISGIYYNTYSSPEILNFVIKRFKILSSFPIIEILGFFAIFFMILFRPFRKRYEN
jgi:hypothetical protein